MVGGIGMRLIITGEESRMPSPIACDEAAQAVTGVPMGPLKPQRIEIHPAARLARKLGMVKGPTRRGPFSMMIFEVSCMTGEPPTPEAMMVAVPCFSASVLGSHPDWAMASAAAVSPYWMK